MSKTSSVRQVILKDFKKQFQNGADRLLAHKNDQD